MTASALPSTLTNWYSGKVANPSATSSGGLLSATPSTASSIPGATADTSASNPALTQAGLLSGSTSNVQNTQPSYTPTTYTASQLNSPNTWNVNPSQTVAGQLSTDLKSNSPLMQQAQTEGSITANARGLLNSSMAAQAGENAMISSATPIATADAATNASAASYNANEANTFSQNNQAALNTAAENNAAAANAASSTNTTTAASLNQQTQSNLQNLSQDFNNNVQAIQSNQYMDQAAKDYNISQLYQSYQSQVTLLQDVGTVPNVGSLLSNPAPSSSAPSAGYTSGPAPAAPAAASGSGGGSVICTYYHDIGWMDEETYRLDSLYGEMMWLENPEFIAWYWSWAYYFVGWLGKGELRTWLFWPLVYFWSQQMKSELNLTKPNVIGKSILCIGKLAFKVMSQFKVYGMADARTK